MTDSVQMELEVETCPSNLSPQKWLLFAELPHNSYQRIKTENFGILNKDKIAFPLSSWIKFLGKLHFLIINKCGPTHSTLLNLSATLRHLK